MKRSFAYALTTSIVLSLTSCTGFWNRDSERAIVARVGDTYLYKDEIQAMMPGSLSESDSISFVTNYINTWATKQILLSKARINLPEDKLSEFDYLVENYRTDLYTRAYKEALVNQAEDTVVSNSEMMRFYEKEKENFRLKEKLVRLRFVQVPPAFMNMDEVREKLRSFDEEDKIYLDSIAIQFRKLNFNDSIWVPVSRVLEEISALNYDNEARYLKKSQFFELEDSLGVYLGRVTDILQVNEIAPLTYIEPTIKQVLLNRRKLDYIRKLETEIIDEATKNNQFEVFEPAN